MIAIDQLSSDAPGAAREDVAVVDHRAARRALQMQIGRLERQLGEAVVAGFPHVAVPDADPPVSGPRLLDLGELERVRDDLTERVRRARLAVSQRAEHEARSRALLQDMLRDPARHKWVRVAAADVGERSCGAYQVRPRLGVIGMLMGWWQVKVSSGCPSSAPA